MKVQRSLGICLHVPAYGYVLACLQVHENAFHSVGVFGCGGKTTCGCAERNLTVVVCLLATVL